MGKVHKKKNVSVCYTASSKPYSFELNIFKRRAEILPRCLLLSNKILQEASTSKNK